MSLRRDPFEALPLDQKALVNNICEQFEHALTCGETARVEDRLAGAADSVRSVLLRELLLLECVDRLRRADAVREEDLLVRFPDCAELICEVVREARRYAAAPPDAAVNRAMPKAEGAESPRKLGRFVLKQLLSSGGFATVYLAEDPEQGSVVALKVPHVEILLTPALRKRFVFEAEAAALLEHPHIVQVIEVGEMGLLCYLASRFVPGTTLAAWLRERKERGQPVPIRSAARLVATLSEAMHHAHERGILHCDLKPANVLLAEGPDLFPVITDFGLARLIGPPSDLSQTGQVLGTPAYMAPEQAAGRRKDLTPRSDVWALGAILYEMLVGAPPFAAASTVQVLYAVLTEDALPLKPRRRDVPADLEAICLKCLEKSPERRYPTAAALADDLGRWLRGEPVQARRTGPLGRVGRWCRRRPVVAALAAALSLAMVVGVSGIVHQWRKAEAARREAEAARYEAEASEVQARELLNELLQPGDNAFLHVMYYRGPPSIDALLKAEKRLKDLLGKSPGDRQVRIALTNLRSNLGTLYGLRGQVAEMDAALQGARDLWEELVNQDPLNPEYRDWLANALDWQASAAVRRGQIARAVQLTLQAVALWDEVPDEQAGNRARSQKAAARRFGLLFRCRVSEGQGKEILRALEEEKTRLVKLIDEEPARTVLRERLALTYLAQGEAYDGMHSPHEAMLCWQQAYGHYKKLPETQPDDLLAKLGLALCCSRLMAEQPPNPYYAVAVSLFEQVSRRQQALFDSYKADYFDFVLPEAYCSLAVCHWKAGREGQAEQVLQEYARLLVTRASQRSGNPQPGMIVVGSLWHAAESLEQAKLIPACLVIAQQMAHLLDLCADVQLHDWALSEDIAERTVQVSALLCRLGRPAEALHQAEQSRRRFAGLRGAAPEVPQYGYGLSNAWERIAKARWELGQRDEALAAFRESAAVEREVVAQAPSVPLYRDRLGRCYQRLTHWGGLRGDRATVAAALLEQEKLWPGNAIELMEVSRAFGKLAETVGKGQERLSPEELAERQSYLTESERIQRAAEQQRK
jgi:tetratricopeptide (TPR) repeat protein